MQSTLSIIKPDAVKKGYAEDICSRIEDSGFNNPESEGFKIQN